MKKNYIDLENIATANSAPYCESSAGMLTFEQLLIELATQSHAY